LPAISGFTMILCWPILNKNFDDSGSFLRETINRGKVQLQRKPMIGAYLLVLGSVMFWVAKVLPSAVQFAFLLFFFSAFAGFLYVFYLKGFKYRRTLLFVFGAFIVLTALSSGMFTVVAYMSLTLFSFFFLGQRVAFWKKLSVLIIGVF